MIADRLRLLGVRVNREPVRHISVFAFGRSPLLVAVGSVLDDTIPTAVYAKRRDDNEGWGWKPGASTVDVESGNGGATGARRTALAVYAPYCPLILERRPNGRRPRNGQGWR